MSEMEHRALRIILRNENADLKIFVWKFHFTIEKRAAICHNITG